MDGWNGAMKEGRKDELLGGWVGKWMDELVNGWMNKCCYNLLFILKQSNVNF